MQSLSLPFALSRPSSHLAFIGYHLPTQVVGPNMGEAYLKMKHKDQEASLAMIEADPDLKGLQKVRI